MTNLANDYLKYHSPGNRYAYFPSTKNWQGTSHFVTDFKNLNFKTSGDYGHLYLHLPFCRSLCTFCGCNIKISHQKEEHHSYIDALKKEAALKDVEGLPLRALTLGGGSPNALHLSALEELVKLVSKLGLGGKEKRANSNTERWSDSLCEIDPVIFKRDQLELLRELGIKRFSIGVQDFDQEICKNVNRHQTLEDLYQTKEYLGHLPFGIDLIFGLPKQEIKHIQAWDKPLRDLSPDWVSLYPLAPVPWLAPYQEAYGDFTLPKVEEKAHLYESAHSVLLDRGYKPFGLGHYIKPDGYLSTSFNTGDLFRSVSGLYPTNHDFTVSLGVGAISEFSNGLHQNERILEKYKVGVLQKNSIPTERYHHFSDKEKSFIESVRMISQTKTLNDQQWELLQSFINGTNESPNLWNESWIERLGETQKVSKIGVLFLKNILQGLEKAYFGLK